ncbi:hypothetical protein, partial [Heyndrickxia sporothermodurans]|uniref:hypothetical protein n=1 Tax=Heyndrickxia sporothermodurans TaxID=46224 RepID=UPI001F2197CA
RTLLGARVAPQHCPIPLAGKNIYFSIVKNMVTKSFTQNNLHNPLIEGFLSKKIATPLNLRIIEVTTHPTTLEKEVTSCTLKL